MKKQAPGSSSTESPPGSSSAASHSPPSQERIWQERILQERTRRLAQRPPTPAPQSALLSLVTFRLAEENYALEASFVREVLPLRDLTPLPGSPPFLLGLTRSHGEFLSVLDLRELLSLHHSGLPDHHVLLVLHALQMDAGIVIDQLLGWETVPRQSLHVTSPPQGLLASCLQGVTASQYLLLDAVALLSESRHRIAQACSRSP